MIEYSETRVSRILNPTGIDLGEYVINPFRGCAYGCLYCYVRSNRVVSRIGKEWGTFVEVRVNAAEQLEKELVRRKPAQVLLGSTTECFQPIELKYRLTGKILEILTREKVGYVILTRSPLITEYIPVLTAGYCRKVYFTVNWYGDQVKNAVEPCSPDFNSRFLAVRALYDAGVPVVPYVSPVLPWVTDIPGVLDRLAGLPDIEFEFLNGNLANFQDICAAIGSVRPQVLDSYKRLAHDRAWYEQTWKKVRLVIDSRKRPGTAGFPIYQHPFGSYFTNVYEKGKDK